jgi:sulfatase maturation enzyme AslB (radical SAM superfamily)
MSGWQSNLLSRVVCRSVGVAYDAARGSFPAVVRIETTSACNAQCVICPHPDMQRRPQPMEESLYQRLINECSESGCREVHLHNFGEPLLDRRLEQRVRDAKQKGIRKVKIFSNGSLISAARARGLVEAGLDEIKISFDGATREEFERIRAPLKFDQVVGNVRELVAIRNELKSTMKIGVACCSTSDKTATMSHLESIVDDFSFGKVHNWATQANSQPPGRWRKPCSRLWRTFTVLADGTVALCCLDYDGKCVLGRIDANTTIRQVFNNAAYQAVRRQHRASRQHEIGLCRGCTKSFLWPASASQAPSAHVSPESVAQPPALVQR